MPDIILHHYHTSPFSEKVRLILGYKGLAWQSVLIPQIMPKPDVVALTGGYRRTPFMQIGADIYCDTALICDELERRFPTPSLYPSTAPAGLVDTVAQWADNQLFWWGAIAYSFQSKAMAFIFDGVPADIVKAFAADRAAMRAGAARTPAADAAGMLRVYLQQIDSMLARSPWLLGQAPSLADFAAYHPLWFVRRIVPLADILSSARHVLPWMDRVAAIGHGQPGKLSSADAIRIAHDAEPAAPTGEWHDEHGVAAGDPVTVTPLDYAFDPVAGELVAATARAYSLRRFDERAGKVVVHFPRVGYKLEKAH